jgi:transcription-repair coupling factor (superfamily II helicase)
MGFELVNNILENQSELRGLVTDLDKAKVYHKRIYLLEAAKPLFISWLNSRLSRPILFISRSVESAGQLYFDLQNWMPESSSLFLLPEIGNYQRENSRFNMEDLSVRLKILSLFKDYDNPQNNHGNKPVVVASALAACSKVISVTDFNKSQGLLEVDMDASPADIVKKWNHIGYEIEEIVEIPGTYCRRGGILDVFPLNRDLPVRIEFLGNKIESIRTFNPRTQKSIDKLNSVQIVVASDNPKSAKQSTILDYLPENSLVITDNEKAIRDVLDDFTEQSTVDNGVNDIKGSCDKKESYLTTDQFIKEITGIKRKLELSFTMESDERDKDVQSLPFSIIPKYGGQLDNFIRDLQAKRELGYRIVIISQQVERLQELLAGKDNVITGGAESKATAAQGTVTFIKGAPSEGWSIKDDVMVYTDNEIFGFIKRPRSQKKRPVKHHLYLEQLQVGDFVVHIDHGIGKFIGLTRFESDGNLNEYIVIEYASGDKLYVPISQIDRISRYVGGRDQRPSLSRLNTQEWSQVKARIKKAVQNIAEELLKLYATRQMITGFAYSRDSVWQSELESSFPYEETADQLEALMEVKADMEKPRPMDRLICGDVGYGKTEIALRAAFKAVMDNKQVAILVPTTVLAQQHYLTFKERLGAFPVEVRVLSRFCSEKEQSDIIQGLAGGSIDICIGTHRLLQKDIMFKDLGLLVIDEEQRFGVAHKEYFKKMRREIDILTLTATPIPRTLHMALSGIKDLSTLETPPEDRLPIKTSISPYSTTIIKDAILNEIRRGGQIFYVHNRIYDIYSVANKLREIMPGVNIEVAHGRMAEEELEEIMLDFVEHKTDVLLTTTIIESGIDIPNTNTLIVDDSDRFGLIQLHQLRGRIGRGSNNAYSYLFYNPNKKLTEEARKRLRTLAEATELGAGFTIAMKDLEIRGAGNLLGTEQSGYIAAIGFDLYTRLLAEAIKELKTAGKTETGTSKVFHEQLEINISLGLSAYIPEDYISLTDMRIQFYKRISNSLSERDLSVIEGELRDRFGKIPVELLNLLYFMKIKHLAKNTKIEAITKVDGKIVIAFRDNAVLSHDFMNSLMKKYEGSLKKGIKQLSIDVHQIKNGWQQVLLGVVEDLNSNQAA